MNKLDYKLNTDKIKELLNSPPALGVEIEHIVSDMINQRTKEQDKYIIECLVRCKVDPDALLKTAQKNRELMYILEDINCRIESGQLVEVVNEQPIEEPELNPCPFCGGKAEIQVTKHTPSGFDYTPRCLNTSCCGRLLKKYSTREAAIWKWNRRSMI